MFNLWHLRHWLQYWQLRTWNHDIFVTWQLIVTLDSIRNSCDVLTLPWAVMFLWNVFSSLVNGCLWFGLWPVLTIGTISCNHAHDVQCSCQHHAHDKYIFRLHLPFEGWWKWIISIFSSLQCPESWGSESYGGINMNF